ncbi:lasso peptide biosynthesis B2 protein [Hydrogenophaga sp. RWCD_12]|uniref:lasso peptide biosynthesis B2 protein n=1 Tax=Hydrogenophaga sp. RWCD_12 TaxID=3391190 RepID=UPI003984BAC8
MSGHASRWARWRALTAEQRSVLLSAWCLLPLVWLALWTLGLPRLQVRMMARAPGAGAPDLVRARDLGRAVNIAASLTPFPVTCLTRSLLLGWMLSRRGMASELRIGVQLSQGVFKAHAWIECEGVPVNDRADVAADFAPFDDLGLVASFDR